MVAKLASGKQLLNLFAYTCSFSVQAAAKGAASTTSVDLSNSYTEWGSENFKLNDLSLQDNRIIRADCMKFLSRERSRYDVIVIDPPTISRSKKMEGMFDVQQDYATVISQALDLLSDGGTLFFSTNFRGFKFDETLFPGYAIREITDKTIPEDFHQKKIHRCWKFMAQ
jgi:23S rRNA G2069 N7-methylase RlmK/C1962 C5-methylase RlmI